ncbi:MAG: N-acetyl-gamma-glutamyl-phosphate reductase [Candidatus Margulisbacteria bacterium]|nr:N-acetyl-gamma-glutamyl-phosphate reductase [Candidatus Margulisiibacteriota bacterium]
MSKKRIGIIGATGYTGHELIKILRNHPQVEIVYATTTTQAGRNINNLYPDLKYLSLVLEEYDLKKIKKTKLDLVFLAVHHGKAMGFVPELLDLGIQVVDLSADFRFSDVKVYEKIYGKHAFPKYCKTAVYGLPEFYRNKIKKAKLLSNPGCYVTSSLLALLPVIEHAENIVVDAKSGVSGAGKKVEEPYLFGNIHNNFKAYAIAKHRHQPEIESYLKKNIEFVPHLLPINRGILCTVYFNSAKSYEFLRKRLTEAYSKEPYVKVLSEQDPAINMVTGTNNCFVNIYKGSKPKSFIIVSVLDNLIKGASGQAVQNMNLMLGLEEQSGLDLAPAYP